MLFYWFILALFLALALSRLVVLWRLRTLRRAGKYPAKGEESEEAARRLLADGERGLAVRCYRSAAGSSLKAASAAVDAMQLAGGRANG